MRTARKMIAVAILAAAAFSQSSKVSANVSCIAFMEECAYYFGCSVVWYSCYGGQCWGDCPCDQNPDVVCDI